MNRINTVSWADCETVTRMCHRLVEAAMVYQKNSKLSCNTDNYLSGDQNVLCEAITLKHKLIQIIERSADKNGYDNS